LKIGQHLANTWTTVFGLLFGPPCIFEIHRDWKKTAPKENAVTCTVYNTIR